MEKRKQRRGKETRGEKVAVRGAQREEEEKEEKNAVGREELKN